MENVKSAEVSVVLPVRNEEKYIEKCIRSILEQDFDKNNMEVLFVDGASEDKTCEIIKGYMQQYPFIKLLQNPQKTVQYALNIGIKNATGEYIVRMDAHSEYAPDYISKCLYYLKKTGAANVGGPMVARGKTPTQKAIAAAYHSPFALGGGKFHNENFEGYADTVYLGSFKRETIMEYGLYDERFPRSEDDELNFRITKNGGKVYINPEIKSVYYPRASLSDLFYQYYEYGVWKVAVIKKHKKPARISHLIPVAFVLFLVLGSILRALHPLLTLGYLTVLALYLSLDIFFSFANEKAENWGTRLRLLLIHPILHISYGFGFLVGIFKFLVLKGIKFDD